MNLCHHTIGRERIILMKLFVMTLLFCALSFRLSAQQLVDKNKGDHNETKLGLMDGNLVAHSLL